MMHVCTNQMSSTELEKLRMMYQDIEEKRKSAVKLLINQPKTIKEEAYINHHVARLSTEIQGLSQKILTTINEGIEREENPMESLYRELNKRIKFHQEIADKQPEAVVEEKDNKNEPEVSMNDLVFDIKGAVHLSLFYDNERYQEWRRQRSNKNSIKSHNKRHKIIIPENDEALTKFSGEECFGKFLDLSQVHRDYLALNVKIVNYLEFLQMVNSGTFDFIPRTPNGEKFIEGFIDYIVSFIKRSQPFFDIEETKNAINKAFQQKNINNFNKKSQFYCVYCDRSFDSEELLQSHFNQKSHSKNMKKAENLGGVDNLIKERNNRKNKFDKLVFTLSQLINIVKAKLQATIENTQRRQTLTAAVMEAEHDLDAPIVFDESDSDDEQHFYNPKGLPLGWDGKPIPYWLYKLHGLSVEYKCEICGNRSYWGALAFERHFFDMRHINGLKALGIPPTRHFVYVTKVSEAVALFDKIKKTLTKEVWQKGDEEIETEDGDVMSLKVYNDLVRQGIYKPKTTTNTTNE